MTFQGFFFPSETNLSDLETLETALPSLRLQGVVFAVDSSFNAAIGIYLTVDIEEV